MNSRDAYTAIADPTRREILDLLCDRGTVMASAIAAHFVHVSRPGISRHLRVLKECGVVTSHRDGKTQNYTLVPEPLNEVRDGWLANFGNMQSERLAALRRRVESKDPRS